MKLDCKNLSCPEPVLKTKEALSSLQIGDILEVIVDNVAAKENVKRFAKSENCDVSVSEDRDIISLKIVKNVTCNMDFSSGAKTLFVKDDKIGVEGLGEKLIVGFFAAMTQSDHIPKEIFFVNRGVFLTCENEECIKSLKQLEEKGCKIYSCGVCLDFYGLNIQVGEIGNAFGVVDGLLKSDGVISI